MNEFINEIAEMNLQQTLERKAKLEEEIRSAASDAELEGMNEKIQAINSRIADLKDLEERNKMAQALQEGTAKAEIIEKKEDRNMDIRELRNTSEYINAYAEYVKSGKDEELRALMTENATSGTIAVPEMVYDIVKTAWDSDEIMSRVSKAEVAGVLKVQFEISGTDAVFHTEGGEAITEETLTEGIASLVPAYAKKFVGVTDEVMSLRGEKFLDYIYREISHKIVKRMADTLVGKIAALPTTATATSPNANKVSTAPAMDTVAKGIANLSDEAARPVIIMNKLTWAEFKKIQYANGYGADPFEGLPVIFNNSIKAYSAASTGDVYAIVGDLGHGALANFPNGEGIEFTFDPYTKKTQDIVEILGKEFVGLGVVACRAFTNITKPATE